MSYFYGDSLGRIKPPPKLVFVKTVILFSAPAHMHAISKGDAQRHVNDTNNDPPEADLPVFEATAMNVSAFIGQTAYLPCRVRNLGDKVVSSCPVSAYSSLLANIDFASKRFLSLLAAAPGSFRLNFMSRRKAVAASRIQFP